MTRRQTVIIAIVLIVVGVQMLLSQYGAPFSLNVTWPAVLLVIGGAMVTAFYVSKPRRHLLLGGCIVISLGVFFLLVENFFGYFSYGRIWPGLIVAYGLGQLVAAFLNRSLRRHALGAIVLIAGGSILFYFTFTRWESLNYSSMMLIIGTSLVIIGLKLVIDYFVEGREKA